MSKHSLNKTYSFDLLADYIDGLVDSKTANTIEKHLEKDNYSKAIVEGILTFYDQEGRNRDALEDYLRDLEVKLDMRMETNAKREHPEEEIVEEDPPVFKRYLPRLYAIAAILLVILMTAGILRFQKSNSAESIVAEALSVPYLSPDEVRSGDSGASIYWEDATYNYSVGKYQRAIATIENLITLGEGDSEKYFYLGLCYLYKRRAQPLEAVQNLRKALDDESVFAEQVYWYLALAYFEASKNEEAKGVLDKILVKFPRHYKLDEVKRLKNKL